MHIRVKTITGKEAVVPVEPEMTVRQMRARIIEQMELEDNRTRVLFMGRNVMDDENKTVRDIGIEDGLVVHVVERPPNVEPLPPDANDDNPHQDDFFTFGGAQLRQFVEDTRRSLGTFGVNEGLVASSSFSIVRDTPFLDRAYTERVIREAVNAMDYVPQEIRNNINIEWRDNTIVLRLPPLTNPHVASPSMERLHVAEMAIRNVQYFRSVVEAEDGLVTLVEQVLRGESTNNEALTEQAVNIALRLETLPEALPRRGSHARPDLMDSKEREHRYEPHPRTDRSEALTMRHILCTDLDEVLLCLQEEMSQMQPLIDLYRRVLNFDRTLHSVNSILDNGMANLLCVFMEHMQRSLHRLSHATHTLSDLNVHMDTPHPRRVWPQYGNFQVNNLTQGEVMIEFIDPHRTSTNVEHTASAADMFHIPVPVNDVRLVPEGVTPLTTLYPTGIVQHVATMTIPILSMDPSAVSTSAPVPAPAQNPVGRSPGGPMRAFVGAAPAGVFMPNMANMPGGANPMRLISVGGAGGIPAIIGAQVNAHGSGVFQLGPMQAQRGPPGQSIIGINRPPNTANSPSIARPSSVPPRGFILPPSTGEIISAIRAIDSGSGTANFQLAMASLVTLIREGHMNVVHSILNTPNPPLLPSQFPSQPAAPAPPVASFAQAAQSIFGTINPMMNHPGVRTPLRPPAGQFVSSSAPSSAVPSANATPPTASAPSVSSTGPVPSPGGEGHSHLCPQHTALRQLNEITSAIRTEVDRTARQQEEALQRASNIRQRIIERRDRRGMASASAPQLTSSQPGPSRLPAGATFNEQLIPIDPFLNCNSRFVRVRNRRQQSHYIELLGDRMPRQSARRDPPVEYRDFPIPMNAARQVILTEGEGENQMGSLVQLAIRSVLSLMREQDAERTARESTPVRQVLQGLGLGMNPAEVTDEIHVDVHIPHDHDDHAHDHNEHVHIGEMQPLLVGSASSEEDMVLDIDVDIEDHMPELMHSPVAEQGQPSTSAEISSPQPKKRKTEAQRNGSTNRSRRQRNLPSSLQNVIDVDISVDALPAQSLSYGYLMGLPLHFRNATSESTGSAVPLRDVLETLNRFHLSRF